jgi:hypothetical protein
MRRADGGHPLGGDNGSFDDEGGGLRENESESERAPERGLVGDDDLASRQARQVAKGSSGVTPVERRLLSGALGPEQFEVRSSLGSPGPGRDWRTFCELLRRGTDIGCSAIVLLCIHSCAMTTLC